MFKINVVDSLKFCCYKEHFNILTRDIENVTYRVYYRNEMGCAESFQRAVWKTRTIKKIVNFAKNSEYHFH